jgi:hypothetical protein
VEEKILMMNFIMDKQTTHKIDYLGITTRQMMAGFRSALTQANRWRNLSGYIL